MALGADRTTHAAGWAYTDLTSRTQTGGSVAITRGRSSGGAQSAQPAKSAVRLDNGDGALTPGHPASTYHPELVRGTPVAIDVEAGDNTLLLPGATGDKAVTPDHADLDITGDISVAVEVESPMYFDYAAAGTILIAKWEQASDERSWALRVNGNGTMTFFWTTAGTSASQLSMTSEISVPTFEAGPAVYGCFLDVDNGSSGRTIRFYAGRGTVADLIADSASFRISTVTESGTTSIYSGTAPLEVGDSVGPISALPYCGRIRKAVLLSGSFSAGTQVANPDFTAQTTGTPTWSDAAGQSWSLAGDAVIDNHYTRLVGELAASNPVWPGEGVETAAQVKWDVGGVLRRMKQGEAPLKSTLRRYVTGRLQIANIHGYWPMEDGSEATKAVSAIAGHPPINIGGSDWRFAAESSLHSSSALPTVSSGLIAYAVEIPPYTANATSQTRVDLFVRIDTPNVTPDGTFIMAIEANGTATRWTLAIDDTNVAVVATDVNGGSIVGSTWPSDSRMFDTWCLWSFNMAQNGGNVDWGINVIPIPLGLNFGAGSAGGASGSFAGTVGRATTVHNWLTPAPDTGGISFGHLIVSSDLVVGWLAPADSAYNGEAACQRFFRLCREEGIPATFDGRYGPTWAEIAELGAPPMGPQRPANLLTLLEEAAIVARARIGETREALGLAWRESHYNQDPAITFGDELINPLAPVDDDQGVINDLTVSRTNAESYNITDDTSIETAGLLDHSMTVNVETDLQLPDLASWVLDESSPRTMRVPSLRVELGKNSGTLIDTWCSVQEGDLLAFDTVPPHWPDVEIRQIMDGYTEEISRHNWDVRINGTSADIYDVGVREDPVLGIRDTGGSVLFADFDAGTDTTLTVATTAGPLWAPTAATNSALPFDIDVGGFRMTCTDIDDQGPIAFGATGTVAHAINASVTPSLPASVAAGNILLAWVAIRNANAGSVSGNDQGYEEVADFGNCSLWAKIAGASEAAPTFTFTGGVANADTSAQIVRFAGNFYSLDRLLVTAAGGLNASAQNIAYPAVQVPEPACLILYLGWKQDDWTSVATIAGATEIGEPDTTTGDDQGIVWDYLIQTTAADIAAGSFVVTGGASAISVGGVAVLRSSVQTFTVTQTPVNLPNDTKTIPAGSPVRLWTPARRAY